MSSPAPGSVPPARPAADASPADRRAADIRSTSQALLDQVLSQTTRAEAHLGESDSPELRALRAVARRHRGEHLIAAEPVVVDLVDALLRPQFHPDFVTSPAWSRMTGQIAQTLVDDPVVLGRLQAFWATLQDLER